MDRSACAEAEIRVTAGAVDLDGILDMPQGGARANGRKWPAWQPTGLQNTWVEQAERNEDVTVAQFFDV